jgi:long-chain fatty acid transport protein
MRRSALTILCTSLLLTTSAYASGFGLRETSASAMGTSYAGAAASGQRASTMAFNPALLGDVDDFDVSFSATGLLPPATGDFTTARTAAGTSISGTKAPTSIIAKAIIPETAIRMRLNDQFSVGLTVSVPWGLMTKYSDAWVGRYYATKSELKTYNFTPVVAYQPVPGLSIAAGLQVEYIKGNLAKAIDFGTLGYPMTPPSALGADDGSVMLSADDWAYGYVLGIAWKPNDNLSLGLSYRSKIDHVLNGTETFTLDAMGVGLYANAHSTTHTFKNSAAHAAISMPDVVNLGARWRIDDRWTALATVEWTGWSVFKELRVIPAEPLNPVDLTTFGWKDSWFGSIGAEYRAGDQWTLRVGTGYDETPTRNVGRTPGIPDGSRTFLSGGVGYRMSDNLDVDLSITHLFINHAPISQLVSASTGENAGRGTLIGTVNSGVTLIGVEITYH